MHDCVWAQDHYTAHGNGNPDATNNTSESIKRILKTFPSSGMKKVKTVFLDCLGNL